MALPVKGLHIEAAHFWFLSLAMWPYLIYFNPLTHKKKENQYASLMTIMGTLLMGEQGLNPF